MLPCYSTRFDWETATQNVDEAYDMRMMPQTQHIPEPPPKESTVLTSGSSSVLMVFIGPVKAFVNVHHGVWSME